MGIISWFINQLISGRPHLVISGRLSRKFTGNSSAKAGLLLVMVEPTLASKRVELRTNTGVVS